MKPFSIDHYLGKELVLDLTGSPEVLTYVGILDRFNWLTNHNSKLSIPQDSDIEDEIKHTEKIIKTLYKYNDSNLSDIQKNTKKIAIFDYENQLKELQYFPYLDYPLNQIGGIHLNTIEFMNSVHPIRTKSEAKAFIKRTDLIKEVYEGTLNDLKKQADNGIYPPEFVYGHVINQLDEFINISNSEHPLYKQFMLKVKKLELSNDEIDYLENEITRSINESVTPGFKLLRNFMANTQKNANKNHGIWSQP